MLLALLLVEEVTHQIVFLEVRHLLPRTDFGELVGRSGAPELRCITLALLVPFRARALFLQKEARGRVACCEVTRNKCHNGVLLMSSGRGGGGKGRCTSSGF